MQRLWQYLNRPDERERYPDGRLVIRGPWAAGAVEWFFDLLPIWLQRAGFLLMQVAAIVLIGCHVGRLLGLY